MSGHWDYHTTIDVDNSFGFVYLITNMITGRKYLGKKQFHSYRKKKRVAETKWQNYTGSSVELNQDIKNMGKANMQHKLDTLTDTDKDGDRNWYNKQIGSIKFIPKEYYP